MGLMTGTTNFKMLKTKYSDFSIPTLEIKVDGTKMVASKDIMVQELSVDLTCGYEASGCEFLIGNCYDSKKKDYESTVIDKFQIGKKVEILVGYKKTEMVFLGYIDTVSYEFGDGIVGEVRVRCMDAKGLLMKNRRLEAFKETSADAVVKSLLSNQPVSYFLSGKDVDTCSKEEVPLRTGMKTDYEIVVEQAEKLGFEFFIIQGKAYFRKAEKTTTPIMTLEPEFCVEEARISFSSNKLVENIEVRSINQENGKMIRGKSKLTGKFSKGTSAGKLYRSTTQVYYEPGVESASEASKRASVRLNAQKSHFGSMELVCVGIPELVPGRFVKLDKFAPIVNGKYYITGITHNFDTNGYTTTVNARRSSL